MDDGYVEQAVAEALGQVRGRGRSSLSQAGESPLLRVRISRDLDQAVRKAAEDAGASRSEWVRRVWTKPRTGPAEAHDIEPGCGPRGLMDPWLGGTTEELLGDYPYLPRLRRAEVGSCHRERARGADGTSGVRFLLDADVSDA